MNEAEIREVLKQKRELEAKRNYFLERLEDGRCKANPKMHEQVKLLTKQLSRIEHWMTLLSEDEASILKRHYCDGVDLPRIAVESKERWGEYAKSERTLKTYQRNALKKIAEFEMSNQEYAEEADEDIS